MSPRKLKPATRRVDRGRNHEYVLDGLKCDGVTSLIGGGIPKPALTAWAARSVAEWIAGHRAVLQALSDDELIDLCKGVPYRERDEAANRGTEVHALASRLARGEEVDVPDPLLGRVDAYLRWVEAWRPENVLVERTVINRKYRYMGTFDWLGVLPELGITLLDIKTGRSGIFAEAGLQAIAYGRAETMLEEDGTETPMPAIDTFAALWLTPDSYEFYVLDVGDRDFRTFLYAAEITRWVKSRAGDKAERPVVGGALLPPTTRAQLSVVKEEPA